jgi:hypothetical protein
VDGKRGRVNGLGVRRTLRRNVSIRGHQPPKLRSGWSRRRNVRLVCLTRFALLLLLRRFAFRLRLVRRFLSLWFRHRGLPGDFQRVAARHARRGVLWRRGRVVPTRHQRMPPIDVFCLDASMRDDRAVERDADERLRQVRGVGQRAPQPLVHPQLRRGMSAHRRRLGQRPRSRAVRVALGTGYNRVIGIGRAWRNAQRCQSCEPKNRLKVWHGATENGILERWTSPKPQRRTRSPRYGVPSCKGKRASRNGPVSALAPETPKVTIQLQLFIAVRFATPAQSQTHDCSRAEGYTYDAKVGALSLVQGPLLPNPIFSGPIRNNHCTALGANTSRWYNASSD